jgi:hypothetical protein
MEAGAGKAIGVKPFRPGVFSSYGNGWRQLWKFFLPLFLIGVIYFVIQGAVSIPQIFTNFSLGKVDFSYSAFASIWAIIIFGFSIFITNPLGYGQNFAYLKASRGDAVEIGDLFSAFKNYWNAVGASLLVSIIVGVGFILLIVPGIFFACKLAFVPYLVVDKKMGVMKTIGESWRMASHGRAWKVFLTGLMSIPILIAGLICLGVGVIISFMWIMAALASLYHSVSLSRVPQSTESPATGAP